MIIDCHQVFSSTLESPGIIRNKSFGYTSACGKSFHTSDECISSHVKNSLQMNHMSYENK